MPFAPTYRYLAGANGIRPPDCKIDACPVWIQLQNYSQRLENQENLPMAYPNSAEAIESLAASIGDNVYIDVAKWHLYLRDAHLSKALAEQLYPLLESGTPTEAQVQTVLKGMMVKLGGGKMEVSLADLLPMQSQVHLMDALEEVQRN
jgi:hypothetical protein